MAISVNGVEVWLTTCWAIKKSGQLKSFKTTVQQSLTAGRKRAATDDETSWQC